MRENMMKTSQNFNLLANINTQAFSQQQSMHKYPGEPK